MQIPTFFPRKNQVGIEPTASHLLCDALPIELSSPLGAGGGMQVLDLGAHYIK